MHAIMGITGQVGGAAARALLGAGQPVRAVVRDVDKGKVWADKGCEVAVADIDDPASLTKAFTGASGVFLMSPPNYDPEPGFPEIRRRIATSTEAIVKARPGRVVFLSTVGAQVTEPTLLSNSCMIEGALRSLPVPTAFLRAAWFMENARWDVEDARKGFIRSFLQPLDHPIPMVAASEIGRTAADLLQETWTGNRIIELEAGRRYSANDVAAAFASALGRPVRTEPIPRESWEGLFRTQGMKNPTPRIRMLDGFNEGWIDFEGGRAEARRGTTSFEEVARRLVAGGAG
ncbi:MAG: NmrA family NAD(P)-binding protein [Xanthobacteraceae bacterium]|nr:NmrA family NAD(P)-binding protein [Xanthobacteraceae bacterium]